MDSPKDILQKIERPLTFASKDNYKNLSNIKDLGKFLLNLLPVLKDSSMPTSDSDFNALIDELLKIFSDYDWQKLELKKDKIEKAQIILGKLKTDIDSLATHAHVYPTDPKTIERISDLKEAAAKLNLPV
ncbi:MAG: hypothetical protein WAN57_09470, partial [Smithella sp.]